MSTRQTTGEPEPIIEGLADLVAPMIEGEKPKAQWRIGTEHEKFVYRQTDRAAP
ncbi:MAG: glutamate--cysteine ligase, partial [Pseudomonadota bacterium]